MDIRLIDLDVRFEIGGDALSGLYRLQDLLARGFEDVFEDWGVEVALQDMAEEWPRPEWADLAPSTQRRKRKSGHIVPLIESGALFRAATQRGAPGNIFEPDPYGIRFGVDDAVIPYASAQHDGTPTIPARPWDDLTGVPIVALQARLEAAIQDAAGVF